MERIDPDRACSECGYDMRGLSFRTPCPECGSDGITTGSSFSPKESKLLKVIDSNLTVKGLLPVPDIRVRLKYWMRMAMFIVIAVALLQALVSFAVISIGLYRICLFQCALIWPIVVMGMMPASVDASMPPVYRTIRKIVPLTQWLWAAGFVLWLFLHVPTTAGTLSGSIHDFSPLFLAHLFAGAGWAALAFWLHDLALRLELDSTAQKCNVVAFSICTLGLLVYILPLTLHNADQVVGGGVTLLWYFYILVFIGPWLFVMILFAKSLYEFASVSSWSIKYEKDIEGRQDRVLKKWDSYEEDRKSNSSV